VNADLAIHRMALRETQSLAVAQVLVATKRVELELMLVRDQPSVDAAVRRMDDESRRASGVMLDRVA
jgi:hypothetical protein